MENRRKYNRTNHGQEENDVLREAEETGETLLGEGEDKGNYHGTSEWTDNSRAAVGEQVDMQENARDKTGPSFGSEFTAQDHDGPVGKDPTTIPDDTSNQETVAIRASQHAECEKSEAGRERK